MKELACASHSVCVTVVVKFQFRRDSDMLSDLHCILLSAYKISVDASE